MKNIKKIQRIEIYIFFYMIFMDLNELLHLFSIKRKWFPFLTINSKVEFKTMPIVLRSFFVKPQM